MHFSQVVLNVTFSGMALKRKMVDIFTMSVQRMEILQ